MVRDQIVHAFECIRPQPEEDHSAEGEGDPEGEVVVEDAPLHRRHDECRADEPEEGPGVSPLPTEPAEVTPAEQWRLVGHGRNATGKRLAGGAGLVPFVPLRSRAPKAERTRCRLSREPVARQGARPDIAATGRQRRAGV